MNAYNPLASMKRLEGAGMARAHAEAIAAEIGEGTSNLVTKEQLDQSLESALNKQLVRFGVLMSAIVALACTIVSVLSSK